MKSLIGAIKDVSESLKKINKDIDLAYQDTLLQIGESLVYFTPLDTGLASSNWNVGLVTVMSERDPEGGKDTGNPKGESSIKAMKKQVKGLSAKDDHVFSNPVEYIGDLEVRFTSPQAPSGMIRPTLARVDVFWTDNLKKYKII